MIGQLAVSEIGVRTADHGSARGLVDETATNPDPDEVVVVGTRKHKPHLDQLKLGSDLLDRCSSITFDKAAKQIRLSCV